MKLVTDGFKKFQLFLNVDNTLSYMWFKNLSMKNTTLFCLFCHFEIFQITMSLVMLLVSFESPRWVIRVHWVGFIMFQPTYGVKKWLNIQQFLTGHLFKSKLKLLGNLGTLLVKLESSQWVGFNESDLEIFRLEVWERLNFE